MADGASYVPVLAVPNSDLDEALAGTGAQVPVTDEPTFGGPGDGGGGAAAPPIPEVAASELDALRIEVHAYDTKMKGTLAALAGLVGLSADKAKIGLEHEASRFSLVPVDGNAATATRFYKVGCAARLFVVTDKIDVSFKLTIPQLAAAAELGYTQGRITIEVQGYTGPIGTIPVPGGLSVESFAEYMSAFQALQTAVFAAENAAYLRPRLLGIVTP